MERMITTTVSGIEKVVVKGKGWTPITEVKETDLVKSEEFNWIKFKPVS